MDWRKLISEENKKGIKEIKIENGKITLYVDPAFLQPVRSSLRMLYEQINIKPFIRIDIC
jgi:hypothetical protein